MKERRCFYFPGQPPLSENKHTAEDRGAIPDLYLEPLPKNCYDENL